MIDFTLTVIITIAITFLTILLDSVSAKILILSKVGRNVLDIDSQINASNLSKDELEQSIKATAKSFRISELQRNIWGGELAIVAVSLDFTAIGIWITNKNIFPFFSRWNTDESDKAILVILCVILIHLILFIASMVTKSIHTHQANEYDSTELPSIFSKNGFHLNKYRLATNSIGFIALISAIVVFTNSL